MSISAELFAVIMAGGAGTRFWPLSRRARPKQMLPFASGRTLLAATVARLSGLVAVERTFVVTSAEVAAAVRADLAALPPENVLVEPAGRDTAACVGWAAWRLRDRAPDAVIAVLPADHVIPDGEALRAALRAAAETALSTGGLVTLGIEPRRPETGFGYLELSDQEPVPGARRVLRFVEKPDRARAEAMLAAGNFRWNAGIFVWTAAAIEREIRRLLPDLATGLDAMTADAAAIGEQAAVERHYPTLPRISVDYGVMERAEAVYAIPVDLGWSDVGSWPALAEVLPAVGGDVTLGDVLAVDTDGCVLVADGPTLACLGVRDLVVVALPDAVLVVPKAQAQRVKELVERLRAAGRDELL